MLHDSRGVVWLWPGRLAKRCHMSATRASNFLGALAIAGLIDPLGYWARRKKSVYVVPPGSELASMARELRRGEFARWLLSRIGGKLHVAAS